MNLTVVVTAFEPAVAVMVAVPVTFSEVRVEVATPLAVVLMTVLLPRMPKSVVKVTGVVSITGLLY